jgi:hypothetical protein
MLLPAVSIWWPVVPGSADPAMFVSSFDPAAKSWNSRSVGILHPIAPKSSMKSSHVLVSEIVPPFTLAVETPVPEAR